MIAPDHDRRFQLALRHHLVEGKTDAVPVAEPDPADARRQALEVDALPRHVEPVMQMLVVRQQLLHLLVGLVDILRIARERDPAERANAAAEQRTDIGRHEARKIERILHADIEGALADVVAVIERRDALRHEIQHRAHMHRHRFLRRLLDRLRIALAPLLPFGERPAGRQIAIERIVRGGLVGDHIGRDAALHQFRIDLGRVAKERDRNGLLLLPARSRIVIASSRSFACMST